MVPDGQRPVVTTSGYTSSTLLTQVIECKRYYDKQRKKHK
jgi:hypothetical protein